MATDDRRSDVPGALLLSASSPRPDVLVVAIDGELDLASAPEAREFLAGTTASAPAHLVLDVTGLRFIAASGIQLFVDVRTEIRDAGSALHLVGVAENAQVITVLDATRVAELFDVRPSVDDVLAGLSGW